MVVVVLLFLSPELYFFALDRSAGPALDKTNRGFLTTTQNQNRLGLVEGSAGGDARFDANPHVRRKQKNAKHEKKQP